jgi:RecA/RadA recombinase
LNFLQDLTKNFDNTMMADSGELVADFSGLIDTGSYMLNAILSGSIYGGVPNNKISGFAGESSTGKTFLVMGIIEKYMKETENSGVIYFDTESAVTKQMFESRGIDTKRVVIVSPSTIEEFRTTSYQMLLKYEELPEKDRPPMLMVLDSLGMLSSLKELEDITSGKNVRDMTKSQLLRGTFRSLALKLANCKVPMLVTNHTYDVIGAYIPTKDMSGGGGLKFAASSIVFLGKKKDRDGKEVVGNFITVMMQKSRFTKEQKKVELKLSFQTGLDRYYGLLPLAEKYDIFEKVGNKYKVDDSGKTYFGKAIDSNPEKFYTKDILDQLDIAARKEYLYGGDEDIDDSTGTDADRDDDFEEFDT